MKSRLMSSKLSQIALISLLTVLTLGLMPGVASAQTDTKSLVFEIKNLSIPSVASISDFINDDSADQAELTTVTLPTPAPLPDNVKLTQIKKPVFQFPPKVLGEERVYMHEPEIRDYVCPKMGPSKCEIFIAVLKGENGTHECTRDNRGVNRNGSLDVGLAQINWNPRYNPPYSIEQLRDCKFNLDIALQKYQARGFQPWYAYTKGTYKKFLKPAPAVAVNAQ